MVFFALLTIYYYVETQSVELLKTVPGLKETIHLQHFHSQSNMGFLKIRKNDEPRRSRTCEFLGNVPILIITLIWMNKWWESLNVDLLSIYMYRSMY